MGEHKTEPMPGPEGLSPDEWVYYCWSDMRRRWSRQEYVSVEDYLPVNYRATVRDETVVDLIYAEYLLRKEYDRPIDHQEYVHRFPHLESGLLRQFAVDDALSSHVLEEFGSTLTGSSDPSTPSTEPVPERIGKYIIVARIGIGGQAEIYRAVHPELGKEVVLKLARDAAGSDAPGLGATERGLVAAEAQILARIEHPNLARIYDLDFHHERPFLVMEFIRGRTLEQYARQEKPSRLEVARLLAKVARGLAVAHRCGIAHLDIKPSNVLIDDGGEPRLIDFGLAHLADAWHEEVLVESSLRGTLHFMSPEQAQGRAEEIDFRSDIFALGGLLFFLLTDSPPYPRGKFSELLQRVRACAWDQERLYHRHIPPRLRNCCLQAMHEDPDQRFRSAEAFAKRLEQCGIRWPRSVVYSVPVVILLLTALAAVSAGRGWFRVGQQSVTPSVAPDANVPSAGQPATAEQLADIPELTVEVWETDRFLKLPEIAPVRGGDQLRITAKIPAGMYYTLFLLTSEGVWEEIQVGQPTGRTAAIRYPEAGKAAPVTGPPGTELILVCGRSSGPLRAADLVAVWEQEPRLPALPDLSVLHVDPAGVSVQQRGRGLGSPVDVPDPESLVCERLDTLRHALCEKTDFFEAIAFSHQ